LMTTLGPVTKEVLQADGSKARGHVIQPGEPIEFTSHRFTRRADGAWHAEYLNLDKMISSLEMYGLDALGTPKPDVIAGKRFVLRNSPHLLAFFDEYCRRSGYTIEAARQTLTLED